MNQPINHSIPAAAPPHDRAFFGHPAGLLTLFFAEMWERFSYYGMRAILVLFLTATTTMGGFGWGRAESGVVLAIYTSMVYLAGVAGGWLADNIMGQRRAVFWGGVIIMSGHICLAFHGTAYFFLGLVLIVMGTGLLKPNISTMVGLLYRREDTRRDSGFAIYYMGINIGSFMGQTVCGFLAQHQWFKDHVLQPLGIAPTDCWHFGFAAAAVGMFLGLVVFVVKGSLMGDAGRHPNPPADEAHARQRQQILWGGGAGLAALLAIGALLAFRGVQLSAETINYLFGGLLLVMTLVSFGKILIYSKLDVQEQRRILVVLCLFFASVLFWMAFEQAAGSLNLFADQKSQLELLGYKFPSSWYQNVNPFGIMILSPFFAWLWLKWGTRAPSSPAKFAIGLVLVGAGFGVAALGSMAFDQHGMRLNPMWLVTVYTCHTIGELFLSPIGLSMVTKLSPQRVVSQVMSVWFLANANANFLAHQTLLLQEKFDINDTWIFGGLTAITVGAGMVLFAATPRLRRLMGDVH